MKRKRTGYTTGTCATAAANAALTYYLSGKKMTRIPVVLPSEDIVSIFVESVVQLEKEGVVRASVIKDAGDDLDVTNKAEIQAELNILSESTRKKRICIKGGQGVGVVTKPGLSVKVGEPAINPVPRAMIVDNLNMIMDKNNSSFDLEVTIIVPDGVEISKETLNERLGIIGGISILGTTGIVHPVSSKAWKDTILASFDVAEANGCKQVMVSTGRTSEKGLQKSIKIEDEACVLMGDYLEFTLKNLNNYKFEHVHYAGMWAKVAKAALGFSNTHVKYGVLTAEDLLGLIQERFQFEEELQSSLSAANNGRDIYERLIKSNRFDVIEAVCRRAKEKMKEMTRLPLSLHLIDPSKKRVIVV